MIPAMVLTHWLLPTFGIDQAFLDRAQQVADAGAAPVVRKGLTERSDELRRMLQARAPDAESAEVRPQAPSRQKCAPAGARFCRLGGCGARFADSAVTSGRGR